MDTYAEKNKVAWEHDTYNFWVSQKGAEGKEEGLRGSGSAASGMPNVM